MTNQHPITPPPKLVREWLGTYFGTTIAGEVSEVELALATQAARWGADQELEACCEWMRDAHFGLSLNTSAYQLRAARRPKPPTLKEQALEALETMPKLVGFESEQDAIRRALEALPND
jgi:hypothetical protein